MTERGSALVEAIIGLALAAVVAAHVIAVLVRLPPQAASWDDSADVRQKLRVLESRVGRAVSGAGPLVLQVDGGTVRVPSIWPRRIGLLRAGAPGQVSTGEVTFVSRPDGQRLLTLDEHMPAGGGVAAATPEPGCGTHPACALAEGDVVLIAAPSSACAFYRVSDAGARLTLDALMPAGASGFEPGARIVPVVLTAIGFDAAARELRTYDGYRSDNVIVDGVDAMSIALEAGERPQPAEGELGGVFFDEAGSWRGTGRLGDGPFVGTGAAAFDIDQLLLRQVIVDAGLSAGASLAVTPARFEWRSAGWH